MDFIKNLILNLIDKRSRTLGIKRSIRVAFTRGRPANRLFKHKSGNLDLHPGTDDGSINQETGGLWSNTSRAVVTHPDPPVMGDSTDTEAVMGGRPVKPSGHDRSNPAQAAEPKGEIGG